MKDFKNFLKIVKVENGNIKDIDIETLKSYDIEIMYTSIVEKQIFNNKKYLFIKFSNIENLEFQLNNYFLLFNPVYAFTYANKGYLILCKNDGWQRLNKYLVGKIKHLKKFMKWIILTVACGIDEIIKGNNEYKFINFNINNIFINPNVKTDKIFKIPYGSRIINFKPIYEIKYIGSNDILENQSKINDCETVPFYSFLYSFNQFMKLYPNITKKFNKILYELTNKDNFLSFNNNDDMQAYIRNKNYYQTMDQIIRSDYLIKFIVDSNINNEFKIYNKLKNGLIKSDNDLIKSDNNLIKGGNSKNNIINMGGDNIDSDIKQMKDDAEYSNKLNQLEKYQNEQIQNEINNEIMFKLNRTINNIIEYHKEQPFIDSNNKLDNDFINSRINNIIKEHKSDSISEFKKYNSELDNKDINSEINNLLKKHKSDSISEFKKYDNELNNNFINSRINNIIKEHKSDSISEFKKYKNSRGIYSIPKLNESFSKIAERTQTQDKDFKISIFNNFINNVLENHPEIKNNDSKNYLEAINKEINDELLQHKTIEENIKDVDEFLNYLNKEINNELLQHKTIEENIKDSKKIKNTDEFLNYLNKEINDELLQHETLDNQYLTDITDPNDIKKEDSRLNRLINESIDRKIKKHDLNFATKNLSNYYDDSDPYSTPEGKIKDAEKETKLSDSDEFYKTPEDVYFAGDNSKSNQNSDDQNDQYIKYSKSSSYTTPEGDTEYIKDESENYYSDGGSEFDINKDINQNVDNYGKEENKYNASRIKNMSDRQTDTQSAHGGVETEKTQNQNNNYQNNNQNQFKYKKPFNSSYNDLKNRSKFNEHREKREFKSYQNNQNQNNQNFKQRDTSNFTTKDSGQKEYLSSFENNIPDDVKNKIMRSSQPQTKAHEDEKGVFSTFNGVVNNSFGVLTNDLMTAKMNAIGQNSYFIMDLLPEKFNANKFNFGKTSDRLELISILKSAILDKKYSGGGGFQDINSIFSIINTLQIITSYPEFQKGNQQQRIDQSLIQITNDYISFMACYPYTIEHKQMRCAKTSVSLNAKIYALLNYEDVLKNVYNPNINYFQPDREKLKKLLSKDDEDYKKIYDDVYKSKDYNLTRSLAYRELGFYNYVKKNLLDTMICPNFPGLIGYTYIKKDLYNPIALSRNNIEYLWSGLNIDDKKKYNVKLFKGSKDLSLNKDDPLVQNLQSDAIYHVCEKLLNILKTQEEPPKEDEDYEKKMKTYKDVENKKEKIINSINNNFPRFYNAYDKKKQIEELYDKMKEEEEEHGNNTDEYKKMDNEFTKYSFQILYDFSRVYLKSYLTDENNKYLFDTTYIKDQNRYSDKSLVVLTENPGYSFKSWLQPEYKLSGNTRIMINSGYRSFEEWESIIFQILYAFQCMIDNNIYIPNLSIDNLFIKESKVDPMNFNYWIYEINNVKYYVPNYGFTVMFDVFHKDNINNELRYDRETLSNIDLTQTFNSVEFISDQDLKNEKERKYDEYIENLD